MNKISTETLKKASTNIVAVLVALSLVFLQWPISGLSHKAVADSVDGAEERLEQAASIDVPLEFEHAYITYADQVIAEPATKVTLPAGADMAFTATADNGYQIESVTATIADDDVKLAIDKDKKYKLTASEVALTSKIKVRAITAPTVDDATVEVAAPEPAPSTEALSAGEAAAPQDGQAAEGGEETESASGADEAPAIDAGAAEAVESAEEADANSASETADSSVLVEVASLAAAELDGLTAGSSASWLTTTLAVTSPSVTPITSDNATVEIAIYPSDADRANRTNPLTSDYEIGVAETLYGAVHFDFNPGDGPRSGRLTYSYTMPDNIRTEDKPAATLYDDAGNRAGTWEIAGGTVYFYYDESWALAHPNGGGNFDFDFTLDEETTETGGDSTFSFPGVTNTITVKVKDAEITGTKANAGVEEGGYVSYTVKLHAQKDYATFIFSDHLEKSLSYVEGSFELDGVPFEVAITENDDGTHDAAAQTRALSAGDHVITYRTKIDQSAYDKMSNWDVMPDTRNTAKWTYGNDGNLKYGSADSWLWVQKNILNKWQSGGLWQGNMVKWTVQVNGSDQYKGDIAGYTVTDTLQSGMTYWNHFNVVDSSWHVIKEVPIPDGATSFSYTFPDDAGANTYYIEYYTIIQDIDQIDKSTTFGNDAQITPPGGGNPTESRSTYTYNPSSGTGDGSGDNAPKPDVTKEVIDQSKAPTSGIVSWHSTLVSDVYPEPEQTSGLVLQYYDTLQNWSNQGDIAQGSTRYYKIWFVGEPQLYANGVKLVKGTDYQFDEQGGRTYGFTSYGQNFEGEDVPVAFRIRFILDSPLMSDVVANKTPIDIYYDTECDGTFQTYYNEGRARITSGNAEVYGKSVQATYDLSGDSRVTKTGWIWFDEERGKYVAQWEIIANRTDSWACETVLPSPVITITDTLPEGMKVIEGSIDLWVVRPEGHGLKYISINPEYTFNQKGNVATFITDLSKAQLQDWQEPFYNEETGECYAWVQLRFQTELDPAYVVHGDDSQTLRNTATAKAGDLPLGTGQAAVSYTDSVISKTGYQNDGEPVVHYTIKVNEKGEKLDPDATHTQVNLTDTLDYRSTVVPSSIKVMESDTDITSECAVTLGDGGHDESGIDTSAFTIKVPDGRSLVIIYDVKLSGVENQWYEVTNSATLNGITNKQTNSKQWFKVNHADASVYGSNTSISITKMDSENILADTALLAGAVFELYRVDLGKLPDGELTDEGLAAASTLVNTVATDEAGSAVLFDETTKAIQYDTLYYFKEVKAPAGYEIDDPAPHFVMTQGSNFYAQNALAESHGIHASPNTVYNVTDTQEDDYHATGKARLGATKTLNGAAPAAGAFSFTLSGSEGVIQTVSNGAAGAVTFDPITYDTDDLEFTGYDDEGRRYVEFTYTIAEDVPDGAVSQIGGKAVVDGMVYDAAPRTVVVRVTDTGEGELVVTYNGEPTCAVAFENEREAVDISGVKAWDDGDNRDGIRPDEVTVRLLANGEDTGLIATATAEGGWAFSFTGLDAIDGSGNAITYTVAEDAVSGYASAVAGSVAAGFTITNRHTPETVEIPVRKVWDDGDNRDGLRKTEVTAKLMVDGKEVDGVKRLKLSEANNWKDKFTNLPKYKDGKEIVYTVEEGTTVAPAYEKSVAGDMADGFVITNTHTPETTTVSGAKSWNDFCDAFGNRPTAVQVVLLADGAEVATAVVTPDANDVWSYEFTDLPVYKEGAVGQKIQYSVSEPTVTDYAPAVNGTNLANSPHLETTQLSVKKVWDDADDEDGKRPDSVTVTLWCDGIDLGSVKLTAANGWAYTWEGLPKHRNGTDAVYTVTESKVAGYNDPVVTGGMAEGYTITNKRDVTPSTRLAILKTSTVDTSARLVGAKFVLTPIDPAGEARTAVTDSNGFATFDQLKRGGTYTLQETIAPGGYQLDDAVYHLTVSNDRDMQITCAEDGMYVWSLDTLRGSGISGNMAAVYDQPDSGYGDLIISKSVHGPVDGPALRSTIGVRVENIETGDYVEFAGIGRANKNSYRTNLLNRSGQPVAQLIISAPGGYDTKVQNLPSGTYRVTEIADGLTDFSGVNGAKSGAGETYVRTTTYSVDGDQTQLIGTSSTNPQTLVIDNTYYGNGSLTLKKEFGWERTGLVGKYAGNLLGGKEEGDTGATGQIMSNITFTITGHNTGEVYTITGNKFNRSTPTQIASASGDTTISVVYQKQQWTITNLPYDTYTVVETSDGYRDEGQEIDTILHKFYTTGTFEVTNDHGTSNVLVGGSTGERAGEGVSESGATVTVSGDDAVMDIMNVYYRPKVVEVTKEWKVPEGVDYTPRDIEVQLVRSINCVDNSLVGSDKKYFYPVTSADVPEHPGYVTKKTLHYDPETGTYDKAIFSMLPAVTANGEQITYEVREVRADGTLVPLVGGYTDENGNTIEGGNFYWDEDGNTATVSTGAGWSPGKAPYADVDGVSRYYSSDKGITLVNTMETTEVSGTKTWDDSNNQDGMRPKSVTVRLMNGDVEVARTTATEAGGWSYSFERLPKYSFGEEIRYTVEEVAVKGYTSTVSGYDIANKHETEKTSITATKVWNDGNNQDGKRPDSIHLQLIGADGAYGDVVELSDEAGWSHTWTDLPKYREGKTIEYRVIETDVPDEYTVSYTTEGETAITVTDSYTPGTTNVSVLKAWEDGFNQDGKRPASVKVQLYADGAATGEAVELGEEAGWSHTWTDLPLMAAGKAITYTVREISGAWSDDYTSKVTGDADAGFTITNAHQPATVGLSGTKTWEDANDQDGIRPESVTVRLYADGVEKDTATMSEANGWKYSFENLPKYATGNEVKYTVAEDAVEGYVTTPDGTNFTNTHAPADTSVSVVKAWDDANNYDGLRPIAVSVQLYANGEASGAAVTLDESNEWSYTWTGLDKFAGGHEVTYTVAETAGKTAAYTTTEPAWNAEQDAFIITNKHVPEKVSVHGEKTWSDNNDQDGKRPSSITVNLLANGSKVLEKTIVADKDGNWTFEFTNLDKYAGGKEIVYTVSEEEVEGYTATIAGSAADGFTITNAYTPEVTDIKVSKVWDDAKNQDGMRPASVTVRLMKNGELFATEVLNAANGWEHTWTKLDRYENRELIDYQVEEVAVEGYEAVVEGNVSSGFTITNTHVPAEVDISVDKAWNDEGDQDGKRADGVQVQLGAKAADAAVELANITTTVTLNAENNWHYAWTDLPQKSNGATIEYSVTELDVPTGYTNTVTSTQAEATEAANASTTFTVANDHVPETTEVSGAKTWVDNDDNDHMRPASITVHLWDGGDDEAASVEATAETGWVYRFENLPKYKDGEPIEYSVTEDVPAGYKATYAEDSYDITNTHAPEATSVSGTKTWRDDGDRDGLRPTSITVRVWNGDEEVATATVRPDENGKWSYEITGLPKFAAGEEIEYRVTEDVPDGYRAAYAEGSFDITNTHAPETTEVEGAKTWSDDNNRDGLRPASITVNLLADGTKVDSQTVTEADGWAYSFTNLPKNRDHGTAIKYTVTEEAVAGYMADIEGYDITNTHTPETTSVSGAKTWDDADNQDGLRPASITVNLLADGVKVKSLPVGPDAEGNWHYTFTDLPKYRDGGTEVEYTVTEEAVAGYTTERDGFNFTNAHAPETVDLSGVKTWEDDGDRDGIRPSSITVHLLADGKNVRTETTDAAHDWAYSFTNLPRFKAGVEIEYTVTEDVPEGYAATYDENSLDITNTYAPETTKVEGAKTWEDDNNRDGLRPASVTVNLLADGAQIASTTATAENGWRYSFNDLPKNRDHGTAITYTVTEEAVAGYTAAIDGFTITNTHEPEKIVVEGEKVWEDDNDRDGIRPASVTVNLLADGSQIKSETVSAGADGRWTYSFDGLPKYRDGGVAIKYTVTESVPAGYDASIEGTTITNTHLPETTSIEGAKHWEDNENQDGARPDSITVRLFADGTEAAQTTATKDGGWTYQFENLPVHKEGSVGVKVVYTVAEDVPEGYQVAYAEDSFDITNTHTPDKTSVSGVKTWNDDNDRDGARPDSITVRLFANGNEVDHATVTEADDWKYSFANLDKYAGGQLITYTVTEDAVEGYTTSRDGYNFTNSYTPQTTSISGSKTWADASNQDGIRPDKVTVRLFADGEEVAHADVTADDNWAYSFTNLPANRDHGKAIAYTVAEDAVEGYTTSASGYNFTNTHTPATTEVTGVKTWNDNNDQDGARPESITIHLWSDQQDDEVASQEITKAADGTWSYSFKDLPKFAGGELIAYSITEDRVGGYEEGVVTGFNVANTHTPETIELSGAKTWVDGDDQDGLRPASITVRLFANGVEKKAVEVSPDSNGAWAYSFGTFPKYEDGEPITYTVKEDAIEGYEASYSGLNVTNTHEPATTEVSGAKTWEDDNDRDRLRPEQIVVRLMNGTAEVDRATVRPGNDGTWSYSFTNLPKYDKGEEITYTVTEEAVEGYEAEYSGYDITNTHTPEKTSVPVSKTWNDANNQDGLRPASITVHLLADGTEVKAEKVTPDASGNWSYTFADLPKNSAGVEIAYTITEDAVGGYEGNVNGYAITNTHTPEETRVAGTKTWNDGNNQDGARPVSITVRLLADGEEVAHATVGETDGWAYEFKGMPKNKAGKAITYTVAEDAVEGYETETDGYSVKNTHAPEKTQVVGTKTWEDADNQDGKRPASITVNLLANGEKVDSATATAANGWKYEFANLDKYAGGQLITYTVTEEAVEGYEADIDGYDITNTHVPETVEVSGTKTWKDGNDQDRIRPESITVRLLADEVEADHATVTAANGWSYSFTDLPKYKGGHEISYTVTEDEVDGYETTIEGTSITNEHAPEVVNIAGEKAWDDDNDRDGLRPDSVTVRLLADGAEVATTTATKDSNWAYQFENMPKNKAGKAIVYTVTEDAVEGYATEIDGYAITNTHAPAKTSVSGAKTWDDNNNQDGARPGKITVRLLADGVEVASADVIEADGWAYRFDDLPVNTAGRAIVYTVAEDAVEGYQAVYAGTSITNKHTPDKTSVSGAKVWDDGNDQDGKRPTSVTVNLFANGEKVDSATVTAAGGWTYQFADLDKYKDGKEIVYTVTEEAVAEYSTTIDGYTVKNTHAPETTGVSGTKTWDDGNDQDGKRPDSVTVRLMNGEKEVARKVVTAADNWAYTFADLPKYEGGVEIRYTVSEIAVDEYTATYDGFNITNTYVPEITLVSGAKTWNDANDQDGKRPESITVNLLADGAKVDSKIVTAGDKWAWSFTDLPANRDHGTAIAYTVTEEPVAGYATEISGYNIANTYTPETVNLSGAKTWVDADNQDGTRPESITVHLLADGKEVASKTVTADDGWAYEFAGMPKFAKGAEIVYTLTEDAPDGYTAVVSGMNVTNTHVPATVEVSGAKTWDDADNQDGKRPKAVTVHLLADDRPVKSVEVTPDENGDWAYSFTGLPKFRDHGIAIVYSVAEEPVDGYEASIAEGSFDITNTHAPEKTSVTGAKVWDDDGNRDGKRPASITVRLFADGDEVDARTIAPDADGVWPAFTFSDLPVYAGGERIEYTLAEDEVPGYETAEIEFPAGTGAVIKNTYTPETTSVSGTKTWEDAEDQDGARPESITVNLIADGTVAQSVVVKPDAQGAWKYSFTNLPKFRDGGTAIVYSVSEDAVAGYEATYTPDTFDIVNTHAPEKTSVKVAKEWNDQDNYDGLRPASIQVQLYADGQPSGEAATLSAASGWLHTWSDLDAFAGGKKIAYTVAEVGAAGGSAYTTTAPAWSDEQGAFVITNTHEVEKVTVRGTKTWSDANNQDGKRPETITVDLLANGSTVKSATVAPDANGAWSFEFADLDKYADGKEIAYTVAERQVEGYTATISGSAAAGFTIDNAYTPEKTSVKVAKVWDDGDDFDGVRPGSVTVHLMRGADVLDTVELNDENSWAHEWTDLDRYAGGTEIAYTVVEDAVPGYTSERSGSITSGFTLKNTHAPTRVDVKVDKAWSDADNQDGMRPESVKVQLRALVDGQLVELAGVETAATLSEANDWHCEWLNLPQLHGGKTIAYSVTESASEGYVSAVTSSQTAATETVNSVITFALTNEHVPDVTEVSVLKSWDDAGDQDGKRPEAITVQLLANDGAYGEPVTLSAANGWMYRWQNLPAKQAGQTVEYHVAEAGVPDDYTASVTGDRETGFVITNSYTPGVTNVSVAKAWDDANNQDGLRPGSVKVRLLADGAPVAAEGVSAEVELSEGNHWAYTWSGLDQMRAGKAITYMVEEVDVVEGYRTTIAGDATDGFVITNAHTPELTQVEATKAWNDDDNRDGVRPAGVALTLYANGEEVATQAVSADARGDWSYTFANLPKFAAGEEIEYTIAEEPVDGYEAAIEGFVATNTHGNETVDVSGTKTWADNDNQDGRRPASITVNLLANGQQVDSKTVTEADGWSYSFTGLNKYRDGGTAIAYTVTEDAVAGYAAAVDGYDIRNTLQVGSLAVSKVVERATQAGARFAFTVTLDDAKVQGQHGGMTFVDGVAMFELADGEAIEATDLPAGVRYTVTEDETPGYTAASRGATGEISSTAAATAHFTNTYNATADVELFAMKSLDGRTLNAEEFTFELLEGGQVIQSAKNAGDGHARFEAITYTLDDLGVHEYQIREAAGSVNGVTYDTTVHDFTVTVTDNGDGTLAVAYGGYNPDEGARFTNTYSPSGKLTLSAGKRLDGATPPADAYEFQLADTSGRVIATATNAADGSVTFPELTFKAAGTYEYVISEIVPQDAQKLGDRIVYDGVFYDRSESKVTVVAIDNFDGTLRFTTTYDSGAPKTFENETAPEVAFPFEVTKTIVGRDFRAGDAFTFTVESPDGAPAPARTSATVRPTGGTEAAVSFGDITFTTADLGNTYIYSVREAGAGEAVDGLTNDPFAHTVTLTVVDAGDGTMGVVAEYDNGADGMVFTNTYAAAGEAQITATKTLTGRALAADEFYFELTGDDLPATLHAGAAADGSIVFPTIKYTQADAGRDFHYTMREVAGTLGGVTYDEREHEVVVHVSDNGDGTLDVTYDYGEGGAAPVFENTYRTENASVKLGAHKALVGGSLEAGAFSFELRGVSANAAGVRQTVANDESGAVSFDEIKYSAAGTYEYRVSEVVPAGATDNGDGTLTGADGIIYDGSEHAVVVTVVDNGYGKLVASVDYDGGASGISFGNTALVRTGFSFDKHYFGGVGAFDFTLTATDENGTPRTGAAADYSDAAVIVDDGSQAFTATVQNGAFADGVAKVVFPEVGYVADGDYHYLIAEDEVDTADMVADKAQYLAHVTVRGGQVANTVFELLYDGENLGIADDLAFYNNSAVTLGFNSLSTQSYTEQGERVSVYPKAKKFLNDSTDQLVGGEFTFELTDEATGSVIAVATNDEQGNIAFFDEGDSMGLAYDEPGTFRYTMREVAGSEADMVYDSSAILLTVDVAEGDDGLVATTTYNGPGGGEPAFYNVKRGMDVTVQKVSRYGGEGLADCTYALWMAGADGDVMVEEATSDAQGYITFRDVALMAGQRYYFKEVEAPKGHTVDPYRTAYFALNESGDALVLVEATAPDGWHPAAEK